MAGGFAAILAVGGAGFLLGRGTSSRESAPSTATPAPIVTPAAPVPTTLVRPQDEIKTRADLVALAAQATDAVASGRGTPQALRDAVGQRFELRLPFGCQGPADDESDASMRWRYDDKAKALRVHVAPIIWSKTDLVATPDQSTMDGVAEGFWISRPWTVSEACPQTQVNPAPAGSEPVTLPGQTLAIAQFFDGEGGRPGRDGKPYETVKRMAPDEVKSAQGFRLRLRGRIAEIPEQGPVSCRQPAGSEQRPICVIAVTLDDVAIENAQTGNTLATWSVGAAGG